MKKLLICGRLFTAESETVQENMAVVLNGNRIEEIIPAAAVLNRDIYDEVIDLSDRFVMPGLFDCHTHVAVNGTFDELGDDVRYSRLPATYALRGVNYARDDLMAGFTSIRDLGCCPEWADVCIRDSIDSGAYPGPRMMVAGLTLNAAGGHGDNSFLPPFSGLGKDNVRAIICGPDQARQAARMNFKYGANCLKFMATFGVLSRSDDPGPQELTYEEMRAAIEIAEFRGYTSCAHAEGRVGINVAVRAGVTSIEHGVFMDEETACLMAEKGTFLVPTLVTMGRMLKNMKPGDFPDYVADKIKRCSQVHAATVNMAYRNGVKIAFGTDVGAPYLPHGSQAEEFVYLVHEAGLKPEHALQAATKVSAETLHWDDRLGTITPGKLADIIAVEGNPVEDISVMQKVSFVMKDGTVYKNDAQSLVGKGERQ